MNEAMLAFFSAALAIAIVTIGEILKDGKDER